MMSRDVLKDKKRIVVKIGSSSITHAESGMLNLRKIEMLVRVLCELKNQGRDVILVSSGAIAAGRQAAGFDHKPERLAEKQALAAIGQAHLMMTYQRLFSDYSHRTAQILLTKFTLTNKESLENASNTMEELFSLGCIPVVNENDVIATHEILFGDNDRLSALVASLVHADLLILMSDIDGLYTGDPRKNKYVGLIHEVDSIDDELLDMAGGAGSDVGTGGMSAKLAAARIATASGIDMVIANADHIRNIYKILDGEEIGTWFHANPDPDFKVEEAARLF